MKKSIYSLLAIVMVAASALSCSKKTDTPHIIFIGFDGLASYTFNEELMPNVKALMDAGTYTMQKRTVLPSSSAVNWASMFMSAGPELHGYTEWGSKTPELPSRVILKNGIFPTIFQILRDARPEAEIGVLYDWDGIKYLVDTLSLSHVAQSIDHHSNPEELSVMAAEYIKSSKPDLLACCFNNPDYVGHTIGWETPEYNEMLKKLDNSVATIVQATKDAGIYENTVFIVTSDHGGYNQGHGGKSMKEMETPFVICGKGIPANGEFSESMMQYDVASTIAELLKISSYAPQVWIGRP
ncbi:MAG: alkaline phosphatase, partial [Bacteroidales bacterium]|nr:alkaline phosphatase [Bacteroidales bacterium]